jgi:hypothetical protein
MVGYYFQNDVIIQMNIVSDDKTANDAKVLFNKKFDKKSESSWEDISTGKRIYIRIYKIKDNYLTIFSYYSLKDR